MGVILWHFTKQNVISLITSPDYV